MAITRRYLRFWCPAPADGDLSKSEVVYFTKPPAARKLFCELSSEGVDRIIEKAKHTGLVTIAFKTSPGAREFRGLCLSRVALETGERSFLEKIGDLAQCVHCGLGVELSIVGTRCIDGARLRVQNESCLGCGLCLCSGRCPLELATRGSALKNE